MFGLAYLLAFEVYLLVSYLVVRGAIKHPAHEEMRPLVQIISSRRRP